MTLAAVHFLHNKMNLLIFRYTYNKNSLTILEMLLFLIRSCSCLLLLLSTPLPAVAVVGAVNIGVIIDTDSQIGREQKIAIEIAAQDFNTSSSGSPLHLNFKNITGVADLTTTNGTWSTVDVVVVAGGGSIWTEEALATFEAGNGRGQVPIISLSKVPSSPPASLQPSLIRMSETGTSQLRCIADIVGSYNWRRVVVLSEDNELETFYKSVSFLSDALRQVESDIEQHKAFPRTAIREVLSELKKGLCRVFVVLHSFRHLPELFQEANDMGMMEEGYVWITKDDITASLKPTTTAPSYTKGVVEVRSYVNQSNPYYENFLQKFHAKGGPSLDPGVLALRAYDAIQIIASAASTATKKKLSKDILIASAGFDGLSGRIQFEGGGELSPSGTRFRIINIVDNGYRVMGFWQEGKGFLKNGEGSSSSSHGTKSAVNVFGPVYWPGGPAYNPGGWDTLGVLIPLNTTFNEFVKLEYYNNGVFKKASGFSIDVFEEAIGRLPYKLNIKKYHPFNGTYDDMVKTVETNKSYYAAVGDITILGNRTKVVDFTHPYIDSGLSKVVSARRVHDARIFMRPFSKKLWSLILGMLVYTGIVVSFLEHPTTNTGRRWGTQFFTGIWAAYSTFFSQGIFHRSSSRVALAVWLFVALVLMQVYTATLASILTVRRLESHSTGVVEKLGSVKDSFVRNYLLQYLNVTPESITEINTETDYPEAFRSGNITAAYLETPYLGVFQLKYGKDYVISGPTLRFGGFGFAFRKGSPITIDVSRAILELIEDGTMRRLKEKAFQVDLSNCPVEKEIETVDSLDVDNFWLLFVISGSTTTIIFLIFLFRLHHRTGQILPICRSRLHHKSSQIQHDGQSQSQGAMEEKHILSPSHKETVDDNGRSTDQQNQISRPRKSLSF